MVEDRSDVRLREQLSNLEGLLVIFMLMTESSSDEDILQLATTSLPTISPRCRLIGTYLLHQEEGWTRGSDVQVDDGLGNRLVLLPPTGGPIDVEGMAWAWAYPMRSQSQQIGYFVVGANEGPPPEEQLLIRLLAWQAGSALASRRGYELEALRTSVRLRDELMSGISHDMQTPLAAMIGFTESLRRNPNLPLTQRKNVYDSLVRQGRNLHGLVQRFLDYARLESDRPVEISVRHTNIGVVIDRVVDLFGHKRTIHVDLGESLEPALADPDRLEQILSNLITNAIKYSPERAPVTITARAVPGGVEIDVIDAGRGMNESDLARLFKKFHRGDSASGTQGSGLGLYISRALVEAQGGRLSAESQPGKGSCFTVFLPTISPDETVRRVLVVDDEDDIRLMVRMQLEADGWEVDEAASGEEALAHCHRAAPGLVVLDQRMPGMQGIDVARRLRDEGLEIPILIFSGYIDPQLEAEAKALGVKNLPKAEVVSLVSAVANLAVAGSSPCSLDEYVISRVE